MPDFAVFVEKEYVNDADDVVTIEGTIEIEAASQQEAEATVKGWMQPTKLPNGGVHVALKTTDPRIDWWGLDSDELFDDGYEYVDFSFGVVPRVD